MDTHSSLVRETVPSKELGFMAKRFGSLYTRNPTLFWYMLALVIFLIILIIALTIIFICCCIRRRRKKKQNEKKPGNKKDQKPSKKENKNTVDVVVAGRDNEPHFSTARDITEKSKEKDGGSQYAHKAPVVPHGMAGPRSDDKNKESATKKGLGSDDNKTAIAGEVQQQQASVGVATSRTPEPKSTGARQKADVKAASAKVSAPSGFNTDEPKSGRPTKKVGPTPPLDKTQDKEKQTHSERSASKHSHEHSDSDCSCSESERSEKPEYKKQEHTDKKKNDADKSEVASAYYIN